MSVKVLKLWIAVACKSAPLLHPPSLPAQLPSLILIVTALWVFSNDNQFHPFFLSLSSTTGTPAVGKKPLYTKIRPDFQSWPSIPFSCVGKMRIRKKAQTPEALSWNLPKVSFLPRVVHTGRNGIVLGSLPSAWPIRALWEGNNGPA